MLVREMRHVEDVEEELPGDATICPRQTIASTRQQTTASPNYCKHATMRLSRTATLVVLYYTLMTSSMLVVPRASPNLVD